MDNERILNAIHDRWLNPPEPIDPPPVFDCDCCGEAVCVGDEYVEFGNGERWIKEHAEELGESHFEKYDDYSIKTAEVDDL